MSYCHGSWITSFARAWLSVNESAAQPGSSTQKCSAGVSNHRDTKYVILNEGGANRLGVAFGVSFACEPVYHQPDPSRTPERVTTRGYTCQIRLLDHRRTVVETRVSLALRLWDFQSHLLNLMPSHHFISRGTMFTDNLPKRHHLSCITSPSFVYH